MIRTLRKLLNRKLRKFSEMNHQEWNPTLLLYNGLINCSEA